MTCNVFGGTLNLAQSINQAASHKNTHSIFAKILPDMYLRTRKITFKFWKPSAYGSGSRNLLTILQHYKFVIFFQNISHISEKPNLNFLENFTKDVSLNKEVLVKFWKSSWSVFVVVCTNLSNDPRCSVDLFYQGTAMIKQLVLINTN